MTLDVALALALGALALGMALGYALGLARGRAELRSYRAGQHDEHVRMSEVMRSHDSGGPCWVKAQVEARAADRPADPE